MERQYLPQSDGTTVVVSDGLKNELTDVVAAVHSAYQWLHEKKRVQAFVTHQ
jgi:hypothetical protein